MNSKVSIRVALIGAGNFAQRQHLPNLYRIPEAMLSIICDMNFDLAERLCSRYAVPASNASSASTPQPESDYRKVLANPDIDAVVIATRSDLQPSLAAEALKAGKHVYVEKPLAESPDECAQVVSARESSGKRLAVGFNKRFAPIYQKAKEIMVADGGPRNIHLRMADDAWRWSKGHKPGDLLKMDVCHFFDLVRWFTSAEITSVYCIASRDNDETLALQMSDNTVVSILFSGHGTMDMPKERMDAVCERGGVSAEDYVELGTYGYKDFEPIYRFSAHSHPDGEFMHSFLTASLGLDGWKAFRRGAWEARERVLGAGTNNDPYASERKRFVERNIPNFMRNQGWLISLQTFITGIRDEVPTAHASAEDALNAAIVSQAALESMKSGEIVRL